MHILSTVHGAIAYRHTLDYGKYLPIFKNSYTGIYLDYIYITQKCKMTIF